MDTLTATPHGALVALGGEWTELVRGREQALLGWLLPVVRNQNVDLDMRQVARIDAAGIAALISLYSGARERGYQFRVACPTPHVSEILGLVGLDRVLMAPAGLRSAERGPCIECPAA